MKDENDIDMIWDEKDDGSVLGETVYIVFARGGQVSKYYYYYWLWSRRLWGWLKFFGWYLRGYRIK